MSEHTRRPGSLFLAATTSYAANCALGAAEATHLVSTRRVRWLHHALYIQTCTLAAAAASSLLWSRSRAGWLLAPAAVPLLLIPRLSARSRRHVVLAASAAPFFLSSTVAARRGDRHSFTKERTGGRRAGRVR